MPLDRVVHRTDEVLLVHQRKELRRLVDGNELEVHAKIPATRLGHLQPVEPFLGASQHQAAGNVHAAALAGYLLDFLVQVDRVLLQLGDVRVAVDRVHAACRVPRRARRQLRTLDQHYVLPAGLGQVVEHTGSDHAAADDRHPGLRSHHPAPDPYTRILPAPKAGPQVIGGAPPSALRRAT